MTLTGACHCGAVRLRIDLAAPLAEVRRCDCSICTKRGAWMVGVPLAALSVVHGADQLAAYAWNTGVAQHYFCRVCGVYTHHRRRSDPSEYAVNVACLNDRNLRSRARFVQLRGRANSLVAGERERFAFHTR